MIVKTLNKCIVPISRVLNCYLVNGDTDSLTYSDITCDETQRKGISRDKVGFLKCLYSLRPCCSNNFTDQNCEQTKHM